MSATIDPVRWAQIESLPLPTGVGNLEDGLCAFARVIYAATGEVSDLSDLICVAMSVRAYVISLNIYLPKSLRQRLGTLAIAERILAADTSRESEQKRAYICADYAVRRFAPLALRKTGLIADAEKLESLGKIVDALTCNAARKAVKVAAAAADVAAVAYSAAAAAYSAEDASYSADDAEYSATFAIDVAVAAKDWDKVAPLAFELLDRILEIRA